VPERDTTVRAADPAADLDAHLERLSGGVSEGRSSVLDTTRSTERLARWARRPTGEARAVIFRALLTRRRAQSFSARC